MTRLAVALLAVVVVGVIPARAVPAAGAVDRAAGPGGFTFAVPAGWWNLSADAPAANRDHVPTVFQEQARSGRYAFLAIDLDHGGDGFMENVNAVVRSPTLPVPVTARFLDYLVLTIRAEMGRRGATYQCLDKKIVKIGDVEVGRLVAEVHDRDVVAKLIQYFIPGSFSQATLTFSTAPETFAHYEPVFDAAAQATLGAVTPYQVRPQVVLTQVIMGAVAATIAVAVIVARRRRAKKTPAAPPLT